MKKTLSLNAFRPLFLLGCALALTACPSEEIKQYKIDKETIQKVKSNADFSYQIPEGWISQSAQGMRKLSFSTDNGAGDISVISLPGKVGDLKGNVNRWRGQLGLAPIGEKDLQKSFVLMKVDGRDALRLELDSPEGKSDKSMQVILVKENAKNWFFKLTGSKATVKKQSPKFKYFIRSLKFKAVKRPANPFQMQAQGQQMPKSDLKLKYNLPKGWLEKEASGMRLVSVSVANGAGDFSVISLPGRAGDLLDNVNRWRGQVGLEPVKETDLKQSFKLIKVGTGDALLLELYAPESKEDKAMRVALYEHLGQSVFFKLSGTRETVRSHSKDFAGFLGSVAFEGGAKGDKLPDPPKGGGLSYSTPENWTKVANTSKFRKASFEVKNTHGEGLVTLVALGGDGGNVLSNINRWRQQLGLKAAEESSLKDTVKTIQVDGSKGYYLSIYTAEKGKAMLIAAIERPGQTWFIKLSGSQALVKSQEIVFQGFLQTLHFKKGGAS